MQRVHFRLVSCVMHLNINKTKSLNFKLAFTLIELLVVIVIIGILATLTTVFLTSTRAKARDARRISDLKQISSALELYNADFNAYPTLITPGQALTSPDGAKTYMNKVPTNPTPRAEGDCADLDYKYFGLDSNYYLFTCLGKVTSDLQTPNLAFNKSGQVKDLIYPGLPATYCLVSSGNFCNTTSTLNLDKTINFDNSYGRLSTHDSWSGDYTHRALVYDFGSVASRQVMIRWKATLNPYPQTLPTYYCVNTNLILEGSTDNVNWTVNKTLNYSYPQQANTPSVVVPDQFDVISGNYRYVRVRAHSSGAASAYTSCLITTSYLYVDGVASY